MRHPFIAKAPTFISGGFAHSAAFRVWAPFSTQTYRHIIEAATNGVDSLGGSRLSRPARADTTSVSFPIAIKPFHCRSNNLYSCLYTAHQRNRAILLLVVEEERPVRKPADKVIAPVLLDNPVFSHADIIPKTRLLYQF